MRFNELFARHRASLPDGDHYNRKGAYTGACNAYDYAAGKQFLLFLSKSGNDWIVSGPPFSRINEEVSGPTAPWVVAVEHYVRIGQLNDYDREKAALRDLQKAAREDRRSYPTGLDRDIEDYFERPLPTKSCADLFSLYRSGTTSQRRDVLWAFTVGKHKEAQPLMQTLMRSAEFPSYIGPVTAFVT